MLQLPDDDFYLQLERRSLMPGWRRKRPNVWPHPVSRFKPAVWRFAEAKAALDASVSFLPAEDTERRNLLLVNPFEGNTYPTTNNLIAAYQMVAPGEAAPVHRHSPAALRLVLQAGAGAVTIVEGRGIEMREGDVVFTPGGCWHGHLNEGSDAAYWIDFLDVPLVQHLEAMFFDKQSGTEALSGDRRSEDVLRHPVHDLLQEAVGDVKVPCAQMPTMGVTAFALAQGEAREIRRSTASSIYALMEGRATVRIEGTDINTTVEKGDVVALPCWNQATISANAFARFLRVSDEPLLQLAGLLREESETTTRKETTCR